MNVGYIQFAPELCDIEATLSKLRPMVGRLAGADLVVLPELANTGYNYSSRAVALDHAEEVSNSVFLNTLTEWCGEYDMTIATGFCERDGDDLYNSACLVNGTGCLGTYRKLHLFLNEKDIFTPGDLGVPVFSVRGVKVAMLVCFDWAFPEVWRLCALKGVQIVCHPSNLVLPGFAQQAIPVHSIINRMFIVTANRIGSEGRLTFTGRSIFTDPRGKVLHSSPEAEADECMVQIDPSEARDKQITPRNDLFGDRRLDVYGDIAR